MAINKIMVLGAGTMGMGIAQVFAEAGKTVIVRDIAEEFNKRGDHCAYQEGTSGHFSSLQRVQSSAIS